MGIQLKTSISKIYSIPCFGWLLRLLLRFPSIPDSTPWAPKGNHLATISTKNTTFKEINSQTSVMVQRDVSPNYNLEKLTRDTQQLAPEREKQYGKSSNCWLNKENCGLDQINNLVLPEILTFLWLTTIHVLNHWSTDKMTVSWTCIRGEILLRL